jgi:hypothetical protein
LPTHLSLFGKAAAFGGCCHQNCGDPHPRTAADCLLLGRNTLKQHGNGCFVGIFRLRACQSRDKGIVDALRSKRQVLAVWRTEISAPPAAGFVVIDRQQRSRSLAFAAEIVLGALFNHGSARDGMSLGMHEDRLQSWLG